MLDLSAGALAALAAQREAGPATPAAAPSRDDLEELRITMLEDFIFTLTGKRVRLVRPGLRGTPDREQGPRSPEPADGGAEVPRQPVPGWALTYDLREEYVERESFSFLAEGRAVAADGRAIEFSVRLSMSREFAVAHRVTVRAGEAAAADPLVVNYSGDAARLTAVKFQFDLDLDGTPDQIPFLAPGSGFLALDRNGDGVINDGSELFGPRSGDGFAELAAFDQDGNGWIDEQDAIFDRLRIWSVGEDGNRRLFALGAAGIGAIYLGNVSAAFTYKDAGNRDLGKVRATGVFLRENGTAGTVQHIDLCV